MMKYYIHVLKNYARFNGRARRSEYWYFILFNFFVSVIAMIIDNLMGTTITMQGAGEMVALPYGYVYIIYAVFMILPSLAVAVRRLHDVNKSGWFLLISLIPIIGAIWLLVLFCTNSDDGPNKYGPNPKGSANDEIDQVGSYLPA